MRISNNLCQVKIARGTRDARHAPVMFNKTDAEGFAFEILNENEGTENEMILFNRCKYCGCLYSEDQ